MNREIFQSVSVSNYRQQHHKIDEYQCIQYAPLHKNPFTINAIDILKIEIDIRKEITEIKKMQEKIDKIRAESLKTQRETAWHPALAIGTAVGATAAIIGATAAIVKIFFT